MGVNGTSCTKTGYSLVKRDDEYEGGLLSHVPELLLLLSRLVVLIMELLKYFNSNGGGDASR